MRRPSESLEPLGDDGEVELARLADDRFVHALLTTSGPGGDVDLDGRVARVVTTLSGRTRRRRRILVPGGLAAAALLAVLVTLVTSGAALADFDRVLEAVARGDRTFLIEVAPEQDPRQVRRPSRARFQRGLRRALDPRRLRARQERPAAIREALRARSFLGPEGLDGGTLYVRGDGYVLVRPLGPFEFVQGFDGEREWRVHPRRGAEEGLGPESTRLPEGVSDLLFVDMIDLLGTVRAEFDVTDHGLVEGEEAGVALRRFTATRRHRTGPSPEDLELFVEDETGLPIELYFGGLRAGRDPRTRYELRLRLADTSPLPADWFTPAAHDG